MTRTLAATNGELLWPGPNRKLPISLNKRQSEEAAAEGAALPDGAGTRKLQWMWREEEMLSSLIDCWMKENRLQRTEFGKQKLFPPAGAA